MHANNERGHQMSSFNNRCVHSARNPITRHPSPLYEQKYLNDLKNRAQQSQDTLRSISSRSSQNFMDTNASQSLIDFFGSIPDYNDVNHLPDNEFYRRIDMLKEKQRSFCDYVYNHKTIQQWPEHYRNLSLSSTPSKDDHPHSQQDTINSKQPSKPSIKSISFPDTYRSYGYKSSSNLSDQQTTDSPILLGKETISPGSRRSVRIESPQSGSLKAAECADKRADDNTNDGGGITIPKPFQMTVRDEENRIVEELLVESKKPVHSKSNSHMFRAHPVPIKSQIPLFDKIMVDQEIRSENVRAQSKARLKSQMRPFSFTKRDEEIQYLTRELSKSSPSLLCHKDDTPTAKQPQFRAKPIPKNLFSNYVYERMHEDEFYRALQRRVRAEEMLKTASLPPAMARREKSKTTRYDVCPRSFRTLKLGHCSSSANQPRIPDPYRLDAFDKELRQLTRELVPTRKRRSKSVQKYPTSRKTHSSCDGSTSDGGIGSMHSVNRSNLAAVLRIQSARKRMDLEMCRRLEENKIKEESRWREKLLRQKHVWQELAYSHEEDLAMRLEMRRDEERQRCEEHRMRMQLMLGRVNQKPTLFERQSQVKFPRTRQELIDQIYSEHAAKSQNKLKKEPKNRTTDAVSNDRIQFEDNQDHIHECIAESLGSTKDSLTTDDGTKE